MIFAHRFLKNMVREDKSSLEFCLHLLPHVTAAGFVHYFIHRPEDIVAMGIAAAGAMDQGMM